jgi:hypothetical protein
MRALHDELPARWQVESYNFTKYLELTENPTYFVLTVNTTSAGLKDLVEQRAS